MVDSQNERDGEGKKNYATPTIMYEKRGKNIYTYIIRKQRT